MLYIAKALQPVESQTDAVHVVVEPGMSSAQIAHLLEQQGLIRNADIFRYYLYFKGKGSRMQAGEYEITPGKSLDEIIEKLETGDVIQIEMVRVTIPEGYTVRQIAQRMGALEAWNEQALLELLSDKDAFELDILQHIPDDPAI